MVVIPDYKSSSKKEISLKEFQTMGLSLEVGNVYKRRSTGGLFLAVKSNLMITYASQVLKEVKPRGRFEVERTLPVGFLLEEGGITARELDRATYLYLDPYSNRNVGVRQRRTKRRGGELEELVLFSDLRLHQIFMPHHKSS
jgi:hypothetical protein